MFLCLYVLLMYIIHMYLLNMINIYNSYHMYIIGIALGEESGSVSEENYARYVRDRLINYIV